MKITWTEEAIRRLGVRTDVPTAGSIFGLSRAQSYKRVKAGTFPVPVIRSGIRLMVPVAPIRRLLEIDAAEPAATDPADNTATDPSEGTHEHRISAA